MIQGLNIAHGMRATRMQNRMYNYQKDW